MEIAARADGRPDRRRLRGQDAQHIEELGAVGADAAIVGSSCVERVADARDAGRDVVEDFHGLLVELGAASESVEAAVNGHQGESNDHPHAVRREDGRTGATA